MALMREHLAKPAHGSGGIEKHAQHAHGRAREKPREDQRDAQRQDKWPRRRCGHHDDRSFRLLDSRLLRSCAALGCRYRPITYTTGRTTAHIASTKCQYIAKTPMRFACSRRTNPRNVNVRMIDSPVRPTMT